MFHLYSSRVWYEITHPVNLVRRIFRKKLYRGAYAYLQENGVLDALMSGDENEIDPDYNDLANMHKLVRRMKPRFSLEFGSGFSTIVIAHALKQNHDEGGQDFMPRLWALEASKHWAKNTTGKIPEDLRPHVEVQYTVARAGLFAEQLCVYFEELPNIVPDFIYLDGPDAPYIDGSVRGLEFLLPENFLRRSVSADILLYESTFRRGATILVDSRYNNVHFLRHNLKRDYRITWNSVSNQTIFRLDEHSGKQHLPLKWDPATKQMTGEFPLKYHQIENQKIHSRTSR